MSIFSMLPIPHQLSIFGETPLFVPASRCSTGAGSYVISKCMDDGSEKYLMIYICTKTPRKHHVCYLSIYQTGALLTIIDS